MEERQRERESESERERESERAREREVSRPILAVGLDVLEPRRRGTWTCTRREEIIRPRPAHFSMSSASIVFTTSMAGIPRHNLYSGMDNRHMVRAKVGDQLYR